MSILDFNDDYGVNSGPRYFPVTPKEYEKLTSECPGGGGNIEPQQTDATFTENGVNIIEPSQGFDGLSSVKVTVDVPVPSIKPEPVSLTFNENGETSINASEYDVDGLANLTININVGGGDYSKWEIGDVVVYDNVEEKKVKSTIEDFSLEKYPESRYTAIGVIAFVMEDGSARMVALPSMSTNTPDVGTTNNEYLYWGDSNKDIADLIDFSGVAAINPTTGEIIGKDNNGIAPSTGDQFAGQLSLDGIRNYYETLSGSFLPSPYNSDGTFNQSFFIQGDNIGPLYCWSRDNEGTIYYMYTDTETPTSETILWCASMGNDSQVKNYGNIEKIGGSFAALMLGSILDESVFDGGVESFVENFTSMPDSTYLAKEYANSDMNGKENCAVILEQQTDFMYDKKNDSDEDMYYWYRVNESDGNTYFLYTDDEEGSITVDTKIYIQGNGSDSFVTDYGTLNRYNGSQWFEIGTIGDGEHITGGVDGFLANFTRLSQSPWRTAANLINSYDEGNYPIATTTWRFHTPGTAQGDWYCPAAGELTILISNFNQVQTCLKKLKSSVHVPVACLSASNSYWSSSEVSVSYAWYYSSNGGLYDGSKDGNCCVRALCRVPALV